jgi:hypothetical protein
MASAHIGYRRVSHFQQATAKTCIAEFSLILQISPWPTDNTAGDVSHFA